MQHWTLDDIDWGAFDPSKVDLELLKVVKAASMVEHNGTDYATYLCNVFADDAEFQAAAEAWALEEVQHGVALARWARMADPAFDFNTCFKRFTDGYRLPLEASASVRGTCAGELVSRCIVETGTSSYYQALAKATDEPVLRQICRHIASDEIHHYKLFYTHLGRYLERDRIGRVRRLLVVLGRIKESEDDELAYAYYVANAPADEPYDRKRYSRAHVRRAYSIYDQRDVERVVTMSFKAAGIQEWRRVRQVIARVGFWLMSRRVARLARAGA